MNTQQGVTNCYDKTAAQYAEKFFHELDDKHLDQVLLQAFATENAHKGTMLDLGCGPGQTTSLLYRSGVRDIIGVDISTAMIDKATELNPEIKFEPGDMLQLKYRANSIGSGLAFYAIVHFDEEELAIAIHQIFSVLKPTGAFLFSFHVGSEKIRQTDFLGQHVDITFIFWETDKIIEMAKKAGFHILDVIERRPYPDIEYPSTRAYVWLQKP